MLRKALLLHEADQRIVIDFGATLQGSDHHAGLVAGEEGF
jgi:hypothetical protein